MEELAEAYSLNAHEQAIVSALREDPDASPDELAEELEIGASAIRDYKEQLLELDVRLW